MANAKSVRKIVENEMSTYQGIDLGKGIKTKGHDRANTANKIFPNSLKGLSLLDLGCNIGSFCIEAKKRGAKKVVGVDAEAEKIKVARSIASHKHCDIQYIAHNIETLDMKENFDFVILLNVIHHLHDPICLLRRVYDHVNRTLIIEFPSIRYLPKANEPKLKKFFKRLDDMPLIHVAINKERKHRSVVPYRYLFSPEAMTRILRYIVGFKRVKIIPSPFKPTEHRHIAFAMK